MKRAEVVIVTPALAQANNGNWQTARRWAGFLAADYRVAVTADWRDGDEALMIALHARRSAASVRAWRARHPQRPLLLVLTGTDLYHDIAVDADAQHALALADRLVVLNELGISALPEPAQARAVVLLQSCPARPRLAKTRRRLRVVIAGHLRSEKSPRTCFEAVRRLAKRHDIVFEHIGAGLEPELAAEARALMEIAVRYRWHGPLAHSRTVAHIRAAHVLIHASRIEGGAHVVSEAVRNGTAVIASRIDGNVGLLGEDYPGYFPSGDAAALASLVARARDEPGLLHRLEAHCDRRAALFDPAREAAMLRSTLAGMFR